MPTSIKVFVASAFFETVAVLMNSVYDWSESAVISLSEKRRICLRPVNETTPHDAANMTVAAIADMILTDLFIGVELFR